MLNDKTKSDAKKIFHSPVGLVPPNAKSQFEYMAIYIVKTYPTLLKRLAMPTN